MVETPITTITLHLKPAQISQSSTPVTPSTVGPTVPVTQTPQSVIVKMDIMANSVKTKIFATMSIATKMLTKEDAMQIPELVSVTGVLLVPVVKLRIVVLLMIFPVTEMEIVSLMMVLVFVIRDGMEMIVRIGLQPRLLQLPLRQRLLLQLPLNRGTNASPNVPIIRTGRPTDAILVTLTSDQNTTNVIMEMLFHFSVTLHWFGIKVSWDVIGPKNKNKLQNMFSFSKTPNCVYGQI